MDTLPFKERGTVASEVCRLARQATTEDGIARLLAFPGLVLRERTRGSQGSTITRRLQWWRDGNIPELLLHEVASLRTSASGFAWRV